MQIFERLRSEHGYTGSRSILHDFIATVRPVRHQAYLKLAFEPGDCMQIDWATHGLMRIGDCTRKLHYFAAVLCYSRLLFVEFFLSQSMECFLAANRHALEYYGASPRRTMHDNLKTAVLERLPGCAPVFNPRYLDFAAHYGFKPVACNVGRGNEKGRVENSIAYIQKNFLNGLQISSLEALNAQARRWMEQVANVRVHRETGKRPCDAFEQEKPTLQPLPLPATISAAAVVCVPLTVAGSPSNPTVTPYPLNTPEPCWNCASRPTTIAIYRGEKLLALHPRNYGHNQDIENPDHLSRLLEERKRGEDAALLARFLALSPKAEAYYGALRQRELHAMGHVRRIHLLIDIHGRDAVAQALEEAVELGAYGSDYLNNILAHRRTLAPLIGQLHLTRGAELLQLEVQPPDCACYQINEQQDPTDH